MKLIVAMASTIPAIQMKLCLIGESGVGKSSLKQRFATDTFDVQIATTVGMDMSRKDISVRTGRGDERGLVKLSLWDTAGQEKYNSITNSSIRNSMGVVLVYDITDATTFNSIATRWLPIIRRECSEALILFIGNKTDMTRVISQEIAVGFAKKESLYYYETSAKTGDNVANAFDTFIRSICKEKELFKPKQAIVDGKVITLTDGRDIRANERTGLTSNTPVVRNEPTNDCGC